jgi:hypothetical protein
VERIVERVPQQIILIVRWDHLGFLPTVAIPSDEGLHAKSVHRDVHALFWDAKMPSVSLATGETVEKSRVRFEVRRLTTTSWTDGSGDVHFDAYCD